MKMYNITVNGKTYEVEVEELGEFAQSNVARPQPKPTPAPKPQPQRQEKPQPQAPKAVSQDAETINAPMPGLIFDIKVAEGDSVKEGDVLLILEAMKMENEIMAPRDGKVVEINTTKGANVDSGDPLVSLE